MTTRGAIDDENQVRRERGGELLPVPPRQGSPEAAQGLVAALERHANIVNLSLGGADESASYANRGAWIDALGPGSNVVSYHGQAWVGSGTSFASSWVSGWAAGTMASGARRPGVVESRTLARWRMPRDAGR